MDKTNFDKDLDTNNKLVLKIFNLVKLQDWKNLVKLIKDNNIDYNIKDQSGIYLLEYAILFNQIELIKCLLDKNTRIDIIDDNNRCILYNIIKFSYIDILKLILEKNISTIGKSVLDIKDNDENTALFYAIKFFNIEAIKIILNYTDNFYVKNADGDNILHVAIKSQNLEIFKQIFSKNNNLKIKNYNGETSLHLIVKYKCHDIFEFVLNKHSDLVADIINNVEYKFNFSVLHYISIYIDIKFLELLDKFNLLKKINGKIQDNSGNIFYHYFLNNILDIKNVLQEDIDNILKYDKICDKIDYNINFYNIEGNISAHILVSNMDFFIKNNLNILINSVLEKSNLNIQNFKGESILFLLVKNNKWKDIKNILINKKLDIFIVDNQQKTIFDYLKKDDLEEFIKIVTTSYIREITNNPSVTYLDYWDNRCKKIVKIQDLNETEKDLLKSINLDKNNLCYSIIYNKLNNYINNFIKNKNRYDVNSFPITEKFVKLIGQYPNVNISTFTGSTIDVLSGLLYLHKKFNKSTDNIVLDSSLKLLNLLNNVVNCNVVNISTNNQICEISGFEILWKNNMLYVPSNKKNDLTRLVITIKNERPKNNIRYLIIPIAIEKIEESITTSHSNYLIFDFELMEVERFEPHGSDHPVGLDYNPKLLDSNIENKISSIPNTKFKYYPPNTYLPKISFQTKEIYELKNDYIGDPNGFCALWCIWWADLRMSNPNIPRKKLVKILLKEFLNENYSFKKIIRDYSFFIINIRDEMFNKANTNINEWTNDTMSQNNLDNLNLIIKEQIQSLE